MQKFHLLCSGLVICTMGVNTFSAVFTFTFSWRQRREAGSCNKHYWQ